MACLHLNTQIWVLYILFVTCDDDSHTVLYISSLKKSAPFGGTSQCIVHDRENTSGDTGEFHFFGTSRLCWGSCFGYQLLYIELKLMTFFCIGLEVEWGDKVKALLQLNHWIL